MKPPAIRYGPAAQLAWTPEQHCVRTIDPPRPVLVAGNAIDHGPTGMLHTNHPPALGTRAAGLRIEQQIQGWQLAWVRLSSGQWRALISIDLTSANTSTTLTGLTALVHPHDLTLPPPEHQPQKDQQ